MINQARTFICSCDSVFISLTAHLNVANQLALGFRYRTVAGKVFGKARLRSLPPPCGNQMKSREFQNGKNSAFTASTAVYVLNHLF